MPAIEKFEMVKSKNEAEPETIVDTSVELALTCFSRLPAELRINIWGLSCGVTRDVDLIPMTIYIIDQHEDPYPTMSHDYASLCLVPAILHVCKEAREKRLRHYKLEIEWINESDNSINETVTTSTRPRIYINWGVYRLCLMYPETFEDSQVHKDVCPEITGQFVDLSIDRGLKHFAINICPSGYFHPLLEMIPWRAKLEELVLFNDKRCWNQYPFDMIQFEDVSDEEYYREWEGHKQKISNAACKFGGLDYTPESLRCCKLRLAGVVNSDYENAN